MQKIFLFLLFTSFIFFTGCHSTESSEPVANVSPSDSTNIFPVTRFLRAQLKKLDTLPVTPLQIVMWKGKTDSSWMKREDIRKEAVPFLSPEIDSINLHSLFTEKAFLDQTINAYTFSYDPKMKLPDSVHLVHWDVYMNPQTNSVDRIYMVKEKDSAGKSVTIQLTWMVNNWFSIRTITQNQEKETNVREEKMIWNFDD